MKKIIHINDDYGGCVDIIYKDESPVIKEINYNNRNLEVSILDGTFNFATLIVQENKYVIGNKIKVNKITLHPNTILTNIEPKLMLENFSDENKIFILEQNDSEYLLVVKVLGDS